MAQKKTRVAPQGRRNDSPNGGGSKGTTPGTPGQTEEGLEEGLLDEMLEDVEYQDVNRQAFFDIPGESIDRFTDIPDRAVVHYARVRWLAKRIKSKEIDAFLSAYAAAAMSRERLSRGEWTVIQAGHPPSENPQGEAPRRGGLLSWLRGG